MTHPHSLSTHDDAVLAALHAAGRPLSAYEVLEAARSDRLRAAVQVYRALDKLGRAGLVHRIEALNAYVACSCGAHRGKPGFVVCRDCGAVREFEDERVFDVAEAAAGRGFAIERVSVEVFGRCAECCAADAPRA
jgi:Fur family transcriptional regulator, zinc uptake regulator